MKRLWYRLTRRQRIAALVAAAILLAAVAVALVVHALSPHVNTDDFRVYYDTRRVVPYADTVRGGVIYINAFDLAEYCGLTVTGSPESVRLYASAGEYVDFTPGSEVADIAGVAVGMPGVAYYDSGALWLPCEFVNSNFNYVTIVINTEYNKLSVYRDEAEGSTTASPVYREVTFLRSGSTVTTTPPTGEDIDAMINAYTFKTDISAYKKYLDPRSADYLVLANKQTPLGADYVPASLVTLDSSLTIYGGVKQLEQTAAMALTAMMQEMRAAGYTDIFVTSAYRDYNYQSSLFATYINREMAADPSLSYDAARARVLEYSAEPGTSEHQTGLCVDLIAIGMTDLDESFASQPVYSWLCDNAYKFGFILRYPQDKVGTTGYSYEPWHYRFVGQYAAAKMHLSGQCLEEYNY